MEQNLTRQGEQLLSSTKLYGNDETPKHKGGFRKIDGGKTPWNKECHHPEHNPPGHIVLQPGAYEYECPGCGRISHINVPAYNW